MELILIYPVFIGIGIAMAQYAHSKGHSARLWFLLGIVLPIISIPMVFLIRQKKKSQTGFHSLVNKEHGDKVLYKKTE